MRAATQSFPSFPARGQAVPTQPPCIASVGSVAPMEESHGRIQDSGLGVERTGRRDRGHCPWSRRVGRNEIQFVKRSLGVRASCSNHRQSRSIPPIKSGAMGCTGVQPIALRSQNMPARRRAASGKARPLHVGPPPLACRSAWQNIGSPVTRFRKPAAWRSSAYSRNPQRRTA